MPKPLQPTEPGLRSRIRVEVWLVLGLSLGQSAVYSIVSLISKLTREATLADQQATINTSLSDRPWLDLTYQILAIIFALVPVALALFFLRGNDQRGSGIERIGLHTKPLIKTLGAGAALAAVIGIPGLALYGVGRLVGMTVDVIPSALDQYWWTIPVLLLAALKAGLVEEVIVVGYLFDRLRILGWNVTAIVITSALLRGSYHLYQGFGPFIGNVVMGLVFGWAYLKWKNLSVLVVAHALIDAVVFVGYPLAYPWLNAVFPTIFG